MFADVRSENTGHGHVRPRPDGLKARCGGPALCPVCARDAGQLKAHKLNHPELPTKGPSK
jgi:hypothetical protein